MDAHHYTMREDEYAAFIGAHADKYLTTFQQFSRDGNDHFSVVWHWPAFFCPFVWMVYRRLYLWALLAFLVGVMIRLLPFELFQCMNTVGLIETGTCVRLLPFGVIPPMIGWLLPRVGFGLIANYIYYIHMKKALLKLPHRHAFSDTQRSAKFAAGGVNSFGEVVGISIGFGAAALMMLTIFLNVSTAIQSAKRTQTYKDMNAIAVALANVHVDTDYYPLQYPENTLSHEIVSRNYYGGPFQDAWHTEFHYVSDGNSYTLISYGKDKTAGDKGYGGYAEDIVFLNGVLIAPDRIR